MEGILVIDKPAGISSFRAVNQVKWLLSRGTKIGHAGTLDPFATGVLLLLVGKATKLCERLMDEPKRYETTIKFGATTATDDPKFPEQPREVITPPTRAQVEAALPRFVGAIQQRPPNFSAIKVSGRRAYAIAVKGEPVILQPRTVQVYRMALLEYEWPLLSLRIDCGRGTYIRSIARDLGEMLEVGGYVAALRRTRVGPFDASDAIAIEQVERDGVAAHLRGYSPPIG